MNNDNHLGLRTALVSMLLVGIALMARCGSDVGPSRSTRCVWTCRTGWTRGSTV